MAILPIAAHSQAEECDLWSKFHLVIIFHFQVTVIFVKVILLPLANLNFQKWMWKMNREADKILLLLKEICSGDCEVDARSYIDDEYEVHFKSNAHSAAKPSRCA